MIYILTTPQEPYQVLLVLYDLHLEAQETGYCSDLLSQIEGIAESLLNLDETNKLLNLNYLVGRLVKGYKTIVVKSIFLSSLPWFSLLCSVEVSGGPRLVSRCFKLDSTKFQSIASRATNYILGAGAFKTPQLKAQLSSISNIFPSFSSTREMVEPAAVVFINSSIWWFDSKIAHNHHEIKSMFYVERHGKVDFVLCLH